MAAASARHVLAVRETPWLNTAIAIAAVTGKTIRVPAWRRWTVRDATYDDIARRLAETRTHAFDTAPTAIPLATPAVIASRTGRLMSVASGAWAR